MAVEIKFDVNGVPETPTLILANRSGNKIGQINAQDIILSDSLNEADEISFKVYKQFNNVKDVLWDKIKDFKLVYCKENRMWYEITVGLDESDETIKNVACTQLAHAELSQILLYDFEVNTEDDIARDDYKPTVLFNPNDESASLLHRMFKDKAQHYSIIHVDSTIANIQRTFSWDGNSILDCCNSIAEEIKCRFDFNYDSEGNGNISRTVAVYDLEANCINCGYRGDFTEECPKCHSTNIDEGYGEDTTIFATADELGEQIQYSTNHGAVKNCFRLEAGDELMTAAIRSCNPNGSNYIWYITDDMKEDMSDELKTKLQEYNQRYEYYRTSYAPDDLDRIYITSYNDLVDKYKIWNNDLEKIEPPAGRQSIIVGYSELMSAIYKTIDMALYLQSGMMPTVEMSATNATQQTTLLTSANLSPVAVTNIQTISSATADSAVLAMAKSIINPNYQVKINSSSFNSSNNCWTGTFVVTNYSDENDTATSAEVVIVINNNYEQYLRQTIQKKLNKENSTTVDVVDLFKMSVSDFTNEIKKYCLDSLNSFYDLCQSCLDILIEQGIADRKTWSDRNLDPNLYDNLYLTYRNKLTAIQNEQNLRQTELESVLGKYNDYTKRIADGTQPELTSCRDAIHQVLNFEQFLGETLWLEFCAYRREDKYENPNFISDGLNNSELLQRANEFIELANKELIKSAELQHSITSKLKNLLVLPQFRPLVNKFKVGNWLRVQVDGKVYKLRLIYYQIDYNNIDSIDVDFSDVLKTADGLSDQQSIIQQASSMASSYNAVQYQANQGAKSKKQLDNWVTNGLALTKMKIVDNADNQNITWDNHGLLCREYLPIVDDYDDKQLKIINKGLYLTDDNWQTSRAGIGNFTFWNPKTEQVEESYGVIADTLVGHLVLSEEVGIYNRNNSIKMDDQGFVITTNVGDDVSYTPFLIRKKGNFNIWSEAYEYENLLSIDNLGNATFRGDIEARSLTLLDDIVVGNQTASLNTTSFKVSRSGLLTASNAVIYGTIYANSGEFSGNITGGTLHIGTENIGYTEISAMGVVMPAIVEISPRPNLQQLYNMKPVDLFSYGSIDGDARLTMFNWDNDNNHQRLATLDIGLEMKSNNPNYNITTMNLNAATVDIPNYNTSSDARKKNSISDIPNSYLNFYDSLIPRIYRYNNGASNRFHVGFVAQEVEKALTDNNLTTYDFAGIINVNKDPNKDYGLRYHEFIALNTWQIQQLKQRVANLEQIINNQTNNI